MSSKVNNSYGSNNVYGQSETKKDRVSTGKSFGDFYVGEQEDDLDPQAQPSDEEDLGAISDDLGSIFGGFGSSKDNYDNDRNDRSSNASRSRTPNRTNTKEVEKDDHKINKLKHKPEFDKLSKFGEQEEPEKLKEIVKTDPLQAFQVPVQVERTFAPTPIQPTANVFPTQMIQQIVQDVRLGVNEMGVAEFQFDLKSDSLDGLKLKVSTKDGQVYATFIAENIHVKETIDQGAQELIKALQDKGLQVANLQVSIGTDSSGTGGQGGFNQGQQGQQGQSNQQNQGYRGYSYAENNSNDSDDTYINTTNTDYTV